VFFEPCLGKVGGPFASKTGETLLLKHLGKATSANLERGFLKRKARSSLVGVKTDLSGLLNPC
jgi:hypothetical protein